MLDWELLEMGCPFLSGKVSYGIGMGHSGRSFNGYACHWNRLRWSRRILAGQSEVTGKKEKAYYSIGMVRLGQSTLFRLMAPCHLSGPTAQRMAGFSLDVKICHLTIRYKYSAIVSPSPLPLLFRRRPQWFRLLPQHQ